MNPSARLAAFAADLAARAYLRKPDQAELLRIKFPDLAAVGAGALNELAFRLRLPRSFRLTTLNVEVTNRCNLRCVYCPVNRGLERPRADLDFERFVELLEKSPTVRTLLPFQWGEPLLHPRITEMIAHAAGRGVRTFLTTNGTRLDASMQRRLLGSGLARLTISVDGDDATHFATRGVALAPIRQRVLELRRRRDATGAALRVDASMVIDETTAPVFPEFVRAWRGVADRVQGIPKLVDAPRTSACREPWRGLLVVLADGRVTTCCADAEGRLALGHVDQADPVAWFNGAPLRALRRAHRRGALPPPCARCGEAVQPAVSARFH